MSMTFPSGRLGRRGFLLGAAGAGTAALAGCSSAPEAAFDLSAADIRRRGSVSGQIVVAEPTALQPLEAERILVKDAAGSVSYLPGGQWADRLPRLIQAKLIQTLENASLIRAVSRPGEGVTADYQLNTELRAFQFDAATGDAYAEMAFKLIALKPGQIVRARVIRARTPVGTASAAAVAQGLDRSLQSIFGEAVRWIESGR